MILNNLETGAGNGLKQAFSAVPLSRFDLMWANRDYKGNIEIEIISTDGWSITMEFIADSTEQIFVRPVRSADSDWQIEEGMPRRARLDALSTSHHDRPDFS